MTSLVCDDCGSLNIVPLPESDDPTWLVTLRDVPGWPERGARYEHYLWIGAWADMFDEDELEQAVESFASVQQKTLKGYTNLVAAFKTHVRKGYHKSNGAPQGNVRPQKNY